MYFDRTREESGFSSINGVTSRSYAATYTAILRAEKEGSFTYGPVTVGGVKSNQVHYSIGKASPRQNNAPGGSDCARRVGR